MDDVLSLELVWSPRSGVEPGGPVRRLCLPGHLFVLGKRRSLKQQSELKHTETH